MRTKVGLWIDHRKAIVVTAFTSHLDVYYDAVIARIGDAESILIFGPGEAKGELRKRIEKGALRGRIRRVDVADKMTGRQIAAKVRQHFALEG